jgi:hypothetical protein
VIALRASASWSLEQKWWTHCASFVIVVAEQELFLRVSPSSKRRHCPARVPLWWGVGLFLSLLFFVTGAACASWYPNQKYWSVVNFGCVFSIDFRAWTSSAIARSSGTIECSARVLFFFKQERPLQVMLNAVVLSCCEWRISSVRICLDYMPVCECICSSKNWLIRFFWFYFVCVCCVLTLALRALLKESTNWLTWWNCGYWAHRQSMSSEVHNLVACGVQQSKPSAWPTNSKRNVYGRQTSTMQESLRRHVLESYLTSRVDEWCVLRSSHTNLASRCKLSRSENSICQKHRIWVNLSSRLKFNFIRFFHFFILSTRGQVKSTK